MSYADSLRNYESDRERERQRILQEKNILLKLFADTAEQAVRRMANVAVQSGEKSVSGYVTKYDGYDVDITYGLDTKESGYSHFVRVDRVTEGLGLDTTYDYGPASESAINLPADDQAMICSVIRNRMAELGFSQYDVHTETVKTYRKEYQTGFFGKKKWVSIPAKDASVLWIEVHW